MRLRRSARELRLRKRGEERPWRADQPSNRAAASHGLLRHRLNPCAGALLEAPRRGRGQGAARGGKAQERGRVGPRPVAERPAGREETGDGKRKKGEELTCGATSPEREERKRAARERGNGRRQAGPCGSGKRRGSAWGGWASGEVGWGAAHAGREEGRGARPRERKERGKGAQGRKESGPG
jgi:hypothetical protein